MLPSHSDPLVARRLRDDRVRELTTDIRARRFLAGRRRAVRRGAAD